MGRIALLSSVSLSSAFLSMFWIGPAAAQNPCARVGQEICQQGSVYRCEKAGSEIAPIFQNRRCVVNVPGLAGTWSGMGRQTPAGPSGSDYPVVMTIGSGGGKIDYPSLNCGGSLSLLSGSATSARYRENITYGKCINGGTVSVNLFRGRLSWSWSGAHAGKQYNVIAVLERR